MADELVPWPSEEYTVPELASIALEGSQPGRLDDAVPITCGLATGNAGGGPTRPSEPTLISSHAVAPGVAAAEPSVVHPTAAASNLQLKVCFFSTVCPVFQPRHVACQTDGSAASRMRSSRMKCQPASTASVVSISMAGLEAPVS